MKRMRKGQQLFESLLGKKKKPIIQNRIKETEVKPSLRRKPHMNLIHGISFSIFFQVTRIILTTLNNPCDHSISKFTENLKPQKFNT